MKKKSLSRFLQALSISVIVSLVSGKRIKKVKFAGDLIKASRIFRAILDGASSVRMKLSTRNCDQHSPQIILSMAQTMSSVRKEESLEKIFRTSLKTNG